MKSVELPGETEIVDVFGSQTEHCVRDGNRAFAKASYSDVIDEALYRW